MENLKSDSVSKVVKEELSLEEALVRLGLKRSKIYSLARKGKIKRPNLIGIRYEHLLDSALPSNCKVFFKQKSNKRNYQ